MTCPAVQRSGQTTRCRNAEALFASANSDAVRDTRALVLRMFGLPGRNSFDIADPGDGPSLLTAASFRQVEEEKQRDRMWKWRRIAPIWKR